MEDDDDDDDDLDEDFDLNDNRPSKEPEPKLPESEEENKLTFITDQQLLSELARRTDGLVVIMEKRITANQYHVSYFANCSIGHVLGLCHQIIMTITKVIMKTEPAE